ncbi:MAG: hypothetical protein FJX72_06025 [Armatimonadetes bacterium]|nr:hypothetical protein [Armatimonadota bacterium]
MNGKTGLVRWEYDTGAPVTTAPAIGTDGTLYFGCADGSIYALQ